ncbi:hypothetical protein A2U01_0086096, partial [Trifolium medium]|nr:hypothetical protein [Trifolium medium]
SGRLEAFFYFVLSVVDPCLSLHEGFSWSHGAFEGL